MCIEQINNNSKVQYTMGFEMQQKVVYKSSLNHVLWDLTQRLEADLATLEPLSPLGESNKNQSLLSLSKKVSPTTSQRNGSSPCPSARGVQRTLGQKDTTDTIDIENQTKLLSYQLQQIVKRLHLVERREINQREQIEQFKRQTA